MTSQSYLLLLKIGQGHFGLLLYPVLNLLAVLIEKTVSSTTLLHVWGCSFAYSQ